MDESGGFERKEKVSVTVVADFMSGGGDFAGRAGQAADISAALKEGGRRVIAGKDFEQLGGGFTGSVVEGERNGGPGAGAAADRGNEPGTGRNANSVSQRACGCDGGRGNGGFEDAGEVGHAQGGKNHCSKARRKKPGAGGRPAIASGGSFSPTTSRKANHRVRGRRLPSPRRDSGPASAAALNPRRWV